MNRKQKQSFIKSVTFRSSVQIKPFQHVHVEASADVPAGESPSVTLAKVKQFVAAELRVAKEGEAAPRAGRFRDLLEEDDFNPTGGWR